MRAAGVYFELGRIFEKRQEEADRRWLPPRLLAGRVVKAERLLLEGRITKRECRAMRRSALNQSESEKDRARVWRIVRELRWLDEQSGSANQAEFQEAAVRFGT